MLCYRLLKQSIHQPEKSDELIECSKLALYLHIPKIYPCRISNGQSTVMFTQAVSALDLAGAFKDHLRCGYAFKVSKLSTVVPVYGKRINFDRAFCLSLFSKPCETK